MNASNIYLNITEGGVMTNAIVFMPSNLMTVAWSVGTNYIQTSVPRVVTITNYVSVPTAAAPSKPIHIPLTTVIGAVFCLICIWRLWWLRMEDKRIKAAREADYDSFLALKHTGRTNL